MMKNKTKYFLYLAISLSLLSPAFGAKKRTESSKLEETVLLNGRRFVPHKEGREFVTRKEVATKQTGEATSRIPEKKRLAKGERSLARLQKLKERIEGKKTKHSHVILQLDEVPDRAKKQELKKAGIHLIEYLPGKAWLARIDKNKADQILKRKEIRWGDSLQPADKVEQRMREKGVPSWAKKKGRVEIIVSVFDGASMDQVRSELEAMSVQVLLFNEAMQSMTVSCLESDMDAIAQLDAVRKVAAPAPPPAAYNGEARPQISADVLQGIPNNLSGNNVAVGIWDEGLVASHPDFGARIVEGDSVAVEVHATHVAGTVGGSGLLSESLGGTAFQWRGMAPGATLLSFDWNFAGSDPTAEYENAINSYNLDISQNSWGINMEAAGRDYYGQYISSCEFFDRFVRGELGRRIPICFAMGNDRSSTTVPPLGPGTYQCVAPPATAKNIISVGATGLYPTEMASFSNVGPTSDGRLKPEIVAPGVSIKSTIPGNVYQESNGTSMATPVVSGVLALLMERTHLEFGDLRLLSSTYKALLCHSAQDIQQPGPDYQSGYGLIQADAADELLRTRNFLEAALSDQAEEDTFKITISEEETELKVTLVWDDYYGSTLINDLDLELVAPDQTVYLPWVLDPANPSVAASNGVDSVNNIEQVYVSDPTPGEWTVRVKGTVLPYEQSYSLVSGQLLSGGVNVQSLAVQNHGKSPLVISNITSVATWIDLGNRNFTVPAGESRGVLVSIQPDGLAVGSHDSSIDIHSNDPNTPVQTVPINLEIVAANQPPAAPSEPVPQNGASSQPPEVGLSWVASDPDAIDSLTFDVYLGTVSGELTQIRDGLENPSTVYQYLAFDSAYYWQVVAKDSQGAVTASPEWTFTSLTAAGDADGDGLTNAQEREVGTNPYREDTDLDGHSDHYERMTGSDPLDATSTPEALITVFYEDFNDGLLDDWYQTSAFTAGWQLQQAVQHSAPYALSITGGDNGSGGFYGEVSNGLIQVDALARYVLSGWIQGNGKFIVYEYDVNGQLIGQIASDIVSSSGFEQIRLILESGSQTASIRVALVGLNGSPAYFDDLKLERAGSTILYLK